MRRLLLIAHFHFHSYIWKYMGTWNISMRHCLKTSFLVIVELTNEVLKCCKLPPHTNSKLHMWLTLTNDSCMFSDALMVVSSVVRQAPALAKSGLTTITHKHCSTWQQWENWGAKMSFCHWDCSCMQFKKTAVTLSTYKYKTTSANQIFAHPCIVMAWVNRRRPLLNIHT